MCQVLDSGIVYIPTSTIEDVGSQYLLKNEPYASNQI
jgi:hypothetical protein